MRPRQALLRRKQVFQGYGMILVTGGAGFIGSNFVLDWLCRSDDPIINLDKLTYAGNLENLASLQGDTRHTFIRGDIGDANLVSSLLNEHKPRAVINFAAESHVDRSIHGPGEFIQTNIVGTSHLLESVWAYWNGLEGRAKTTFHFLHVSTDEVYGSLKKDALAFKETNRYEPIARTRPAKRQATISFALIITPMGYRCSPPTVPTTTAPTIFRKNSSH